MSKSNSSKKTTVSKRSILITSAVVLVALVGMASFLFLNNGNTFLSSASPSPQAQTPSSPATSPDQSTSPVTDVNTLKISQLGIEVKNIPEELSDLSYTFNVGQNGIKGVSFSSSSLETLCPDYSIGALDRGEGKYAYNPHIALTKQLDGFWIAFEHVQSACTTSDKQVPDLWNTKVSALSKLLSNPDNIQAL